jgi:ribonuclease R
MAKSKGKGTKRVTRKQLVAMVEQLFERTGGERLELKEIFRTLNLTTHPAKMLCMDVLEQMLEEDFLTGASNVSLIWISGHEIGEEINSEDTWTLD